MYTISEVFEDLCIQFQWCLKTIVCNLSGMQTLMYIGLVMKSLECRLLEEPLLHNSLSYAYKTYVIVMVPVYGIYGLSFLAYLPAGLLIYRQIYGSTCYCSLRFGVAASGYIW